MAMLSEREMLYHTRVENDRLRLERDEAARAAFTRGAKLTDTEAENSLLEGLLSDVRSQLKATESANTWLVQRLDASDGSFRLLQSEYANLQRRCDNLQECNDRQFALLKNREHEQLQEGSVADLRVRLDSLTAEYKYVCNECGDLEATLAKVREAVE